ncbi:hypothetical protein ACNFBR_00840 [Pseudomonas sp. NY11955]|uniref:hypothetical protein n=1 Tax=Pseudomonas sp. NY11955 TaxID=3400363 RepID=UPI003A836738
MCESNEQAASGKLVQSSLLSFMSGVSREARGDLLLANAYAQQVAWGDLNEGLELDWFRNYWRNLAALGFDGKLAPTVRQPGPNRDSVAKQAVAQINAVASAAHTTLAERSLQALRNDEQALVAFESRTVHQGRGYFQLLPCAQQANGFIDMVLLHMELSLKQSSKGFLFIDLHREVAVKDLRVEVIRFNLQGFRQNYRRRAEASVDRSNEKVIRDLLL